MTHSGRSLNVELIVPRESKQPSNHIWVDFIGWGVGDSENQDWIGRRNAVQHANKRGDDSIAKSVIPGLNGRQINDTWLVTLHFGKQLHNCGLGRL